jgi:hypothetical protein
MSDTDNEEDILFRATWVYLIYSAYNDVRCNASTRLGTLDIYDMMKHKIRLLSGKTRPNDWLRFTPPSPN